MTSTLLEVLSQAPGSPQAPPPFTAFAFGKALITVSFCALMSVGLTARAVWRSGRGGPEHRAGARSTMDASLFWGALAGLTGLFHTVAGLMVTALSVRRSAPIEPEAHELIAGGIAAALGAGAYGLLVLLLAALVWFGLRAWYLRASPRVP